MPDSLLGRKLRGPMADWDLTNLLLRRMDAHLAGANYQRSGGKGQKPRPIDLPDSKGRGGNPAAAKPSGAEMAQRLRNMGMIPPGASE